MGLIRYFRKLEGEIDNTPEELRLEELWMAEMDSPNDNGILHLLNDNRVQKQFDRHPEIENIFVISVLPKQLTEAPQCWHVRVTFSNRYVNDDGDVQFGPGIGLPAVDPTTEPAKISYGSYTKRKEFEFAYDEQEKLTVPVITAAGEPIYLEDEVEYGVINISKNVTRLKDMFIRKRRFINKDAVKIAGVSYAPGELMARNFTISEKQSKITTLPTGAIWQRFDYFVFSYQLHLSPDVPLLSQSGWDRTVRHAGFLALDKAEYDPVTSQRNFNRKVIAIQVGNPPQWPTSPVPIQADGTVYPAFAKATKQTPIDPQTLRDIWKEARLNFRTVERINFTGNLPLR